MSLIYANWHNICLRHPERGAERMKLADLLETEGRLFGSKQKIIITKDELVRKFLETKHRLPSKMKKL